MPSIIDRLTSFVSRTPTVVEAPSQALEKKSVIIVDAITEPTRAAFNKAYIPRWLSNPPFGYPRDTTSSTVYLRHLGKNSAYFVMAKSAVIDNVASIPWDIVPEEGREDEFFDDDGKLKPEKEKEKRHIKNFLMNPNDSHETFEDVFVRMPLNDVFDIGEGVWVKLYDESLRMVAVVCRDASTFTKNPDQHGSYEDREDLIIGKTVVDDSFDNIDKFHEIRAGSARYHGAYFQFGWLTSRAPTPFGRRELVWLTQEPRTDEIYPVSPIAVVHRELQAMIYAVENTLEYLNDNNVPKGFFKMLDAPQAEVDAFKIQWHTAMRVRDSYGNVKKISNHVPFVNRDVDYVPIELTPEQLQIIEQQKWYAKLVWAVVGVPPSELGFTEDAKGQSSQIVQNKLVFRKRAVHPKLSLIDRGINRGIIPEFGYDGWMFKWQLEDIEEQTAKSNLTKMRLESGEYTVNEVRIASGREGVEWGDQPPSQWRAAETVINAGQRDFEKQKEEAMDTDEDGKVPKKRDSSLKPKEKKSDFFLETKPFAGYRNFKDCVGQNQDKENPEAFCAAVMERTEGKSPEAKALGTDSPLALGPNEQPHEAGRMRSAIVYVLNQYEKNLIELIKRAINEGDSTIGLKSLVEIKGLEDVISMITNMLGLNELKKLVNTIIRNNFYKGWQKAENKLNLDLPVDWEAVAFLEDYAFDRIKEMTEEVANDLRRELQTAVIEREGIAKIRKRGS
ncbi:MAG: phage portal protein, partial [Candidatus Heimdallarchaeota archaeon]|nr:phage portal protein [Candidatus Heimdallarchaeota archaeon]